MNRLDLLKQMSFGSQVAEEEVSALASYFVETNQWARIANGDMDIIRGEKGAGKSAIYALLITKVGDFFDRGLLLVPAENPRGATVFKDLVADPPTSEREFIVLWKLYALSIIAQVMRDYDVRGNNAKQVYRTLEEARLLEKEFSLASVLRRSELCGVSVNCNYTSSSASSTISAGLSLCTISYTICYFSFSMHGNASINPPINKIDIGKSLVSGTFLAVRIMIFSACSTVRSRLGGRQKNRCLCSRASRASTLSNPSIMPLRYILSRLCEVESFGT
jgi:hypothetical protein